MSSYNKKEGKTQNNTENLENKSSNPIYSEGDQQMATTISSFNNFKKTKEDKFLEEKIEYNRTLNNYFKTQISIVSQKKFSKTKKDL